MKRQAQAGAPGTSKRPSWLRRAEWLLGASVLVALLATALDVLFRKLPPEVRFGRHVVASFGVTAAETALLALAALVVVSAERAASRPVRSRSPLVGRLWSALLYGLAVAAGGWSTAHWTFGGQGIQGTWWAAWGPLVAVCGLGVGAAVAAWIFAGAWERVETGRRTLAIVVVTSYTLAGVVLAYVDFTVYVALYARLHTMLEAIAAALVLAAFALGLRVLCSVAPPTRGLARTLTMISSCWLLVFSSLDAVREDLDGTLTHVWLHPMHVGRALQRLQLVESFLADPAAWQGAGMARLERLRDKYDIGAATEAPAWKELAPKTDPALERAVRKLRSAARVRNVLVFYVDTLRADVAFDASIMPNLGRFARESLSFTRAYSAAPDTVGALPTMISGRFTLDEDQPDLLKVARDGGIHTGLVIAQSAGEFLERHLPMFHFDDDERIADYAESKQVWGYGADRPTASAVVDRALKWIDGHPDERFLLWLFHYDLHNWRELDRPYVYETAQRLNVPDEAPLNWRYRVVAASIDAELGRLLDGLERRGLDRDTAVVVVADHGEGLGAGGFWVHGVFLWDMLVRIPIAIRIPGIAPHAIDMPVGHVDLLSTLAPFLAPSAPLGLQHGEDLLRWVVRPGRARRLPLLMASTSRNELVRLGLVARRPPFKLVLPIQSSEPELYDVDRPDPDDHNLAAHESAQLLPLLDELVRCPLFPRVPADLTGARWRTPSSEEGTGPGSPRH